MSDCNHCNINNCTCNGLHNPVCNNCGEVAGRTAAPVWKEHNPSVGRQVGPDESWQYGSMKNEDEYGTMEDVKQDEDLLQKKYLKYKNKYLKLKYNN